MEGLFVEPAEEGDPDLEYFLKGHRQGPFLRCNCALALVARRGQGAGAVVGFLELTDEPAVLDEASSGGGNGAAVACCALSTEAAAWLEAEPEALGFNPGSVFVRRYTIADTAAGGAAAVGLALLRAAFGVAPSLQAVLHASAGELPCGLAVLLGRDALFARASGLRQPGIQLFAATRRSVVPQLVVRRARVQDNDEMAALLQRGAAGRHAGLVQLPESCRPDEPFALTRLIDCQDRGNAVLVVHTPGCETLVGMLAATCDVDLPLLQSSFDLGPFDAFLDPSDYERLEERARTLALSKAADALAAEAALCGGGQEGEGAAPAAHQGADLEERVRQILAGLLQEALDSSGGNSGATAGVDRQPGHRLFAVTMLCLQEGWEVQAPDLLAAAFELFGDKDYAALTLPHDSPEPPLGRLMTVLTPAGGPASAGASMFPDAVLLAHRASLLSDFEVRKAVAEDMHAVQPLLEGLPDAPRLGERIALAMGCGMAMVALLHGEVVGAAAFAEPADLPRLRGAYDLDALLAPAAEWPAKQQAALEAVVVNPLFEPHSSAFLTRALALLKRRAALYAPAPGTPPAPAVAASAPQVAVRRRRRQEAAAQQPEGGPSSSLFAFTRSLALKRPVHARIVIVGASDTGLSCLEALLTGPRHRGTLFTHLALLSPGGLAAAAASAASGPLAASALGRFALETLERLRLQGLVADVDGTLGAIDTERRVAVLQDGRELPYDVLAIATGLQDPLVPRIAAVRPEAAPFVVPAPELAGAIAAAAAGTGAAAPRPGSGTLLVGDSLDAFTALSALLDSGIDASGVTWVSDHSTCDLGGVARRPGPTALARALAKRAGLDLPAPQAGRLWDVRAAECGEGCCSAVVQAPDGPRVLEVGTIAAAGPLAPDVHVASALAAAGLVIDGRAVVGAAFETAVPSVLAAGPVAKLSRRCHSTQMFLENYNSAEVGACLADAVAAAATGWRVNRACEAPVAKAWPRALRAALGASCRLPGGWSFSLAARGEAMAAPSLVAPPGGASLLSAADGGAGGLLSIVTEPGGCIRQACAVARDGSSLADLLTSLPGLVGLPLSYLGLQPPAGAARGPLEVATDVAAALSEPWAEALLHDGFGALRAAMLSAAEAGQERGGEMGQAAAAARWCEAEGGVEARIAAAVSAFVDARGPEDLPRLREGLSAARAAVEVRSPSACAKADLPQ